MLTGFIKRLKINMDYYTFNPLPHRDPFNAFANNADTDQVALVRAA